MEESQINIRWIQSPFWDQSDRAHQQEPMSAAIDELTQALIELYKTPSMEEYSYSVVIPELLDAMAPEYRIRCLQKKMQRFAPSCTLHAGLVFKDAPKEGPLQVVNVLYKPHTENWNAQHSILQDPTHLAFHVHKSGQIVLGPMLPNNV